MMREQLRRVVVVVLVSTVFGCARDPAPPDAGGRPCDADVQCAAPDADVCGAVRACVAGRCERTDLDAGVSSWVLGCAAPDAATAH